MNNTPNTILFLVNPFAGKGNALLIAKNVVEIMKQNGYDTELFEGKNKDDIFNFTNIFEIKKIKKIAIFGGDGTMHDIINAIMIKPEWLAIPLLLFPCGTGNSFSRDLDCLSVEKATELLINGKEMLVDLAEIKMNENTIWSFNIIGCGLVSHINILAEKLRWLGAARYNIATIINIIVNPVLKAKIYFNNEMHAKDYCFLLACNTRFTGKGMEMAPLAKLNDGLIDFLIVEKTSRLKLLMLFPKIFSGKHLNSPYLRYVQTNYIKIETQKPERINIDGEMKGNTSLEIIVHKHKLKVFI